MFEIQLLKPALEGGEPHHPSLSSPLSQLGEVPDGGGRASGQRAQLFRMKEKDERSQRELEYSGNQFHERAELCIGLVDLLKFVWR